MPGKILAKGKLLGVLNNTGRTFSTACRACLSTFCMKALRLLSGFTGIK